MLLGTIVPRSDSSFSISLSNPSQRMCAKYSLQAGSCELTA
jgi:hypothetical protein